jgi:hypothetical protein
MHGQVMGQQPFQQQPALLRPPAAPQTHAGGFPPLLAAPRPATAPAPSYGGAAPSSDPIMEAIRNLSWGQGLSRASGARLSAMNASPNDPSLVAYGGLMGQIGGQSDASNMSQVAGLEWKKKMAQQAWDEQMLRLKARLEAENQPNPLMGILGTAAGSFLGPAGMAAGNALGTAAGEKWF